MTIRDTKPINFQQTKIGSMAETVLAQSAEKILGRTSLYSKVQNWLQSLTFQRALNRAHKRFTIKHVEWADSCFDEHFVQHYAAPLWLRYKQTSILPTSVELAETWAGQFGSDSPARRYITKFTPIAADFLNLLEAELQPASH